MAMVGQWGLGAAWSIVAKTLFVFCDFFFPYITKTSGFGTLQRFPQMSKGYVGVFRVILFHVVFFISLKFHEYSFRCQAWLVFKVSVIRCSGLP